MKLLLDTHILLWALRDDEHLSAAARDLLVKDDNILYYSTASIWEVAIKNAVKPDKIKISGQELSDLCHQAGYRMVSIRDEHVCALETIVRPVQSKPHNDPFDRIMLAQAVADGFSFVTHDALLADYQMDCILMV